MRLPKIVLFLVGVTLIKLVTSCFIFDCKCPSPMLVDLDFNQATIQPIGNTGLFISNYPTKSDTLPEKAVAFLIELRDTINTETYPEWTKCKATKPILSGFNTAMAFSCDCDMANFLPKRKLKSISISTLFDLTNNIKAGDDITHLFVGRQENVYDATNLYQTIDEVMDYHNKIEVYDEAFTSFAIYLQGEVQNDSLQFEMNLNFDDNTCITNSTPTLYINHPQP